MEAQGQELQRFLSHQKPCKQKESEVFKEFFKKRKRKKKKDNLEFCMQRKSILGVKEKHKTKRIPISGHAPQEKFFKSYLGRRKTL